MTYVLIVAAALGGVLLFLLAAASANTALFADYYQLLLGLNGAIAAGLLALVIYQLAVLIRQRRANVFGSRLTLRVLVMFAVVSVVPGALVYMVSVQFLTKSIESWFNLRVDNALEGGLNLARTAIKPLLEDLTAKAHAMALQLADMNDGQRLAALNRLREQAAVEDALLIAGNGRVLAGSSRSLTKLFPPIPSASLLRQARDSRGYAGIESDGGKGLVLRAIVPINSFSLTDETRLVQLLHPVPAALAETAENVQSVYQAYRELSLSRRGLKEVYILTLTMTLLFTLFCALALAFLLSRRLSTPLSVLAQGTQTVARGDFSARVPVTSSDEMGILSQSFNSMTGQLDEARQATERSRAALETAKAYLENILANLSAGVLVFDRQLDLNIANRGAGEILHGDLTSLQGKNLQQWDQFKTLANTIAEKFQAPQTTTWQHQLDLPETASVLLLRGSTLPQSSGGGFVVVFDDITQLVAAQRATAWGEVARRLAHEIKNPLTPIQLSAERLQAKLASRVSLADAEILDRAVGTIVSQVTAMKNMVDEFREYARTPPPKLQGLDLNALIRDVLALYENSAVRIAVRLADSLPRVQGDPIQLRQVIHNLLQNAQDAMVGTIEPGIEVATQGLENEVRLTISDNGSGFPEAILQRAFEPYVTTKPKGTGLGLAIVKKIVEEHHGRVALENRAQQGAAVHVSLPLAA